MKKRGTNPQVCLCFTFSIQIYSANANKRSWGKKKASLTVLAFMQGTLCSLMPRFRHKEKHVFLKNSCQIGWQIPRACLAHLLVLAMGVARSAHVK